MRDGFTCVRFKPSELRVNRRLKDAFGDHFIVRDMQRARALNEDTMVKLDNENMPDGGRWFRLGDFWLDLAYAGWHREDQ